jgi:hypothetical protein
MKQVLLALISCIGLTGLTSPALANSSTTARITCSPVAAGGVSYVFEDRNRLGGYRCVQKGSGKCGGSVCLWAPGLLLQAVGPNGKPFAQVESKAGMKKWDFNDWHRQIDFEGDNTTLSLEADREVVNDPSQLPWVSSNQKFEIQQQPAVTLPGKNPTTLDADGTKYSCVYSELPTAEVKDDSPRPAPYYPKTKKKIPGCGK